MEFRLIDKNKTRVKLSNKREKIVIEQLKYLGLAPSKKSSKYTYFIFAGDIATTVKCLGLEY